MPAFRPITARKKKLISNTSQERKWTFAQNENGSHVHFLWHFSGGWFSIRGPTNIKKEQEVELKTKLKALTCKRKIIANVHFPQILANNSKNQQCPLFEYNVQLC